MSRSEISISLEDLVVVIVIKVVVVVELQSRLSGISLSLAQGPVWTYLGLSGTSLSKAQGPICSFLELVVRRVAAGKFSDSLREVNSPPKESGRLIDQFVLFFGDSGISLLLSRPSLDGARRVRETY